MIYICTKLRENISNGKSYGSDMILILIFTKGHNFVNIARTVIILVFAHRLIMVYICTKFRENILNGSRVMERIRFVTNRQTNRHT